MAKAETPKKKSSNIADFDAKFGGAVVDVRSLARNSGFRSTGSLKFDSLLRGGLPKGTMVEYWGPPQSGKSTAATKALGLVLQQGGTGAYFDLERGLDLVHEVDPDEVPEVLLAAKDATAEEVAEVIDKRQSWLRANGIDPFHENFRIYDPDHGEQMFEMLQEIVLGNLFDFVVVDSVAAIITRAELEGEAGESHFGAVAKLLSVELKKLMRAYKENNNTSIIWINQARDKIGYMAKGQKSTGGHALEHFVGTKVRFTKIGRKEVGDDVMTETKIKVDKSRYASAKEITLFISGERGLDTLSELLDYGVDFGYIQTSGNWHYFFAEPVEADAFKTANAKKKIEELPGYMGKANGQAKALDWMAENGWQEKLYSLALKTL